MVKMYLTTTLMKELEEAIMSNFDKMITGQVFNSQLRVSAGHVFTLEEYTFDVMNNYLKVCVKEVSDNLRLKYGEYTHYTDFRVDHEQIDGPLNRIRITALLLRD